MQSVDELKFVVLYTICLVRLGRLVLHVVDDASQFSRSAEFLVLWALLYCG